MLFLITSISTVLLGAEVDYSLYRDIEGFNSSIYESGFQHEFPENAWGWSWQANIVTNNIILGIENINGNLHQEDESLSINLQFKSRMFEIGYLLDFEKFLLPIKAGAGYARIGSRIESMSDTSTFSGILKNPGGNAYLSASCLSLTLNAGLIIPISDYLGIHLSGGYLHGLSIPDWKFKNGQQIYGDPEMEIHHFYAKGGMVLGEFK